MEALLIMGQRQARRDSARLRELQQPVLRVGLCVLCVLRVLGLTVFLVLF